LILGAEKARRFANFLAAAVAAILLGLRGFFSEFYLYFTRTGHLDLTMTGRTTTWAEGATFLKKSPWVGFGFQADRLYVGAHMHNAFLAVLLQSGLLGGGAMLLGFAIVWFYIIRYFFLHKPADRTLIPPEIPAVFLFVTISSITESTFAYFSAAWLLSAPIVAYLLVLHRKIHQASMVAVKARWMRQRLEKRQLREADSPALEGLRPSTLGGRGRS
jgi:O-antigen ligase